MKQRGREIGKGQLSDLLLSALRDGASIGVDEDELVLGANGGLELLTAGDLLVNHCER